MKNTVHMYKQMFSDCERIGGCQKVQISKKNKTHSNVDHENNQIRLLLLCNYTPNTTSTHLRANKQ